MNPLNPSGGPGASLRDVEQTQSEQRTRDYRSAASHIAENILNQKEVSMTGPIDLNVIDEFAVHAALFRWVREASDGLPENFGDRQTAKAKIIACWQAQQDEPESKAAKELDLSGLNLSRLPETIGLLKGLKVLNLTGNQLEYLPNCLSKLVNLEELNCNSNGFDDLPEVITELPNLKRLEITDNAVAYVPDTISRLRNLEYLDLSDNMFKQIPESIGQLRSLNHLDLSTNMVSLLPESVGQLLELVYLNCADNELSHFPETIQRLPKLDKFIKEGNLPDRKKYSFPQM